MIIQKPVIRGVVATRSPNSDQHPLRPYALPAFSKVHVSVFQSLQAAAYAAVSTLCSEVSSLQATVTTALHRSVAEPIGFQEIVTSALHIVVTEPLELSMTALSATASAMVDDYFQSDYIFHAYAGRDRDVYLTPNYCDGYIQ